MFRSSGTVTSTSCLSLRGTKQSHSNISNSKRSIKSFRYLYLFFGRVPRAGLSVTSPRPISLSLHWSAGFSLLSLTRYRFHNKLCISEFNLLINFPLFCFQKRSHLFNCHFIQTQRSFILC